MTERWRARSQTDMARISNYVSGGQCHLIHLAIPREDLLVQFGPHVHRGGIKQCSFHLYIYGTLCKCQMK